MLICWILSGSNDAYSVYNIKKQYRRRFCSVIVLIYADEKEKYDPSTFRDSIVQGLTDAQGDIEQVYQHANYYLLYYFCVKTYA